MTFVFRLYFHTGGHDLSNLGIVTKYQTRYPAGLAQLSALPGVSKSGPRKVQDQTSGTTRSLIRSSKEQESGALGFGPSHL